MDEHFHRLGPLVLFTSLVIVSAGVVAGMALAWALVALSGTGMAMTPQAGFKLLAISLGLLVASGVVALLHLARPWRAPFAVKGLGRSRLSAEVMVTGLFAIFTFLALLSFRGTPGSLGEMLLMIAGAMGLLASLSVGLAYALPGQIAWKRASQALGPICAALLLAASLAMLLTLKHGLTFLLYGFFTFWAIDFGLAIHRLKAHADIARPGHGLVYPRLQTPVLALLLSRCVLSILPPGLFLFGWENLWPFLIAGLVLLDRLQFYGAAIQNTPKSETARIKAERMARALGIAGNNKL